jgi:hypothetical protein
MRRISRLALGAAVVMAASAAVVGQDPAKAPAPAAAATTDLFPLKAGSKWTYKVGDNQTIEVKVETVTGGEALLTTLVNGKPVARESVKVQPDGVFRTKINDSPITPPVKFLELPAKKDKSWPIDSKVQDQAIKGKFTITDEKEKAKVRDKDYEAVVVNGPEFDIAGTKTAVKYWFAPGKGIIKLSYTIAGSDAVLELVDYTEGK